MVILALICIASCITAGPNEDLLQAGTLEGVKAAIAAGANINAVGSGPFYETALMGAARRGDHETARYLLEQGAQVTYKDATSGNSALKIAAEQRNAPMMDLLLQHGADKKELTELLCNTFFGNGQEDEETRAKVDEEACTWAELLISHGADPNDQTSISMTPLMWAAYTNLSKTVAYLLEHGADINLIDGAGRTALTIAKERKNTAIISLLESHQASLHLALRVLAHAPSAAAAVLETKNPLHELRQRAATARAARLTSLTQ